MSRNELCRRTIANVTVLILFQLRDQLRLLVENCPPPPQNVSFDLSVIVMILTMPESSNWLLKSVYVTLASRYLILHSVKLQHKIVCVGSIYLTDQQREYCWRVPLVWSQKPLWDEHFLLQVCFSQDGQQHINQRAKQVAMESRWSSAVKTTTY